MHMLRMMKQILELEKYRALTASTAEVALDIFAEGQPDLVLLDIIMPGMDGYALCQCIRDFSRVPIIMVTARGKEEEKVTGLGAGADDYITKPFSVKELAARVKALLRRTVLWEERPVPLFCYSDLAVDFARRQVTLAGEEVILTATEYRLLAYLSLNAGVTLTADQILAEVWGREYIGEYHLLQVNIARLRRKLRDTTANPRYIFTRSGIGYMMLNKA